MVELHSSISDEVIMSVLVLVPYVQRFQEMQTVDIDTNRSIHSQHDSRIVQFDINQCDIPQLDKITLPSVKNHSIGMLEVHGTRQLDISHFSIIQVEREMSVLELKLYIIILLEPIILVLVTLQFVV